MHHLLVQLLLLLMVQICRSPLAIRMIWTGDDRMEDKAPADGDDRARWKTRHQRMGMIGGKTRHQRMGMIGQDGRQGTSGW